MHFQFSSIPGHLQQSGCKYPSSNLLTSWDYISYIILISGKLNDFKIAFSSCWRFLSCLGRVNWAGHRWCIFTMVNKVIKCRKMEFLDNGHVQLVHESVCSPPECGKGCHCPSHRHLSWLPSLTLLQGSCRVRRVLAASLGYVTDNSCYLVRCLAGRFWDMWPRARVPGSWTPISNSNRGKESSKKRLAETRKQADRDREEDRAWVLALYLICVGCRLLPASELRDISEVEDLSGGASS